MWKDSSLDRYNGSAGKAEFQQHEYRDYVKIKDKDSIFSASLPLKGWHGDILNFCYCFTCTGKETPNLVLIPSIILGFPSQFISNSIVMPLPPSSMIETPKNNIDLGLPVCTMENIVPND